MKEIKLVTKKLYSVRSHVFCANYFRDDKIFDWIRVPGRYSHKGKTSARQKTKVACFFHPVVTIKDTPPTNSCYGYRIIHVSFQSTSSCNISTTNVLNKFKLTVSKQERCYDHKKRFLGIEMNAARELYLGMYSRLSRIDDLSKNWQLKFRS